MNAAATLNASPPLALREACQKMVRHLRTLGYPHADHTTCERMLRAFFPYKPILTEGSPDVQAGADFLERFVNECSQRQLETCSPRARRCYGQAVEEAVTAAESHGEQPHRAPRLTELMTQLDADGHNTTQLRLELEGLLDELGMRQFYS
jgi:hypothetical protein